MVQKRRYDVLTEIGKNKPNAVIYDIHILSGRFDDVVKAFVRTQSISEDVVNMPLAVVDPSADAVFIAFYENTAFNAGQILKCFDDMESARFWIKNRMR
ncbi:hypothetical protein JW948_07415 [bacterium]|nr:hypothetical protein [bacterium]